MASKGHALKKALLIVLGVLVAIVVIGLPLMVGIRPFIGPKVRPLTDRRFEPTPARLERGKYLVTSAATPCIMCHSPMDVTGGGLRVVQGKELTGRNWAPTALPFVTAMNLTPDPETGIGNRSPTTSSRARSARASRTTGARCFRSCRTRRSAPCPTKTCVDHRVSAIAAPAAQRAATLGDSVPLEPPHERTAAADRRAGHG